MWHASIECVGGGVTRVVSSASCPRPARRRKACPGPCHRHSRSDRQSQRTLQGGTPGASCSPVVLPAGRPRCPEGILYLCRTRTLYQLPSFILSMNAAERTQFADHVVPMFEVFLEGSTSWTKCGNTTGLSISTQRTLIKVNKFLLDFYKPARREAEGRAPQAGRLPALAHAVHVPLPRRARGLFPLHARGRGGRLRRCGVGSY